MHIKIAEKLRPFTSILGTKLILPGTTLRLTVYPTRIEFDDLSYSQPKHLGHQDLPLNGPIEGFTVEQDLEKGCIKMWGHSRDGYFRYSWDKENTPYKTAQITPNLERLSLGCHKKQDWAQIMRRFDMHEIFPFLCHLAQWIPTQKPAIYEGTASLLPFCCQAIQAGDRTKILEPFKNVLRAGFEELLSPRLIDEDHQGFSLKPLKGEAIPLTLITETALLIRSLFIQQKEQQHYKILPALPVPFHCGRFINIHCGNDGTLDMEWTKKTIRRMVFLAQKEGEIQFEFPKEIKTFRLRRNEKDRGRKCTAKETIIVQAGQTYILDRFEK